MLVIFGFSFSDRISIPPPDIITRITGPLDADATSEIRRFCCPGRVISTLSTVSASIERSEPITRTIASAEAASFLALSSWTMSHFTFRQPELIYFPENPRTPKPLTFSKNRLREAKNRSNTSPVAKKKFRKNDFFFSKTLHMCKKKKLHMCTCTYAKIKKKLFFWKFVFATGLVFERFLASRNRFFEKVNGLGYNENDNYCVVVGTNLFLKKKINLNTKWKI
ncbi:hypothetical protein LXL04_029341 [Taraxacum kok-saghyz]